MKANIYLEREKEPANEFTYSRLTVTLGLWVDGKLYWIGENQEKLIPEEALSIRVKVGSCHSKANTQEVFIKNHGKETRNIRMLFIHHHRRVSREHLTFVSPVERAIFHVRNENIFLVNGQCQGETIEQATVQPLWNLHTEHIWDSIENGVLKYQPVSKGLMASLFSLKANVKVNETCKAIAWIIFGDNKNELIQLNKVVKSQYS